MVVAATTGAVAIVVAVAVAVVVAMVALVGVVVVVCFCLCVVAGAGVVAVRRAGAMHAFDSLNHFFLISEMIVVGSSYWNIGIGREKGEVADDEEGMNTMKTLGENIGWLLGKLK